MLLVLLLFSQAKGKEVYIIGDSLIVGSQSYIKEFLKGHEVKIFAKVGRHFTSAFEFVDKVSPNSIVVVNLFNNSAVSYQQIVRMIGILSQKQAKIVFVNTHVPRVWKSYNNYNLQIAKTHYPYIIVVDWDSFMQVFCKNKACLLSDGVHLTNYGSYLYALAIAMSVLSFQPVNSY